MLPTRSDRPTLGPYALLATVAGGGLALVPATPVLAGAVLLGVLVLVLVLVLLDRR